MGCKAQSNVRFKDFPDWLYDLFPVYDFLDIIENIWKSVGSLSILYESHMVAGVDEGNSDLISAFVICHLDPHICVRQASLPKSDRVDVYECFSESVLL